MRNIRLPVSLKQVIIVGLLVIFIFLMMDMNSRLSDLSRQKRYLATIQMDVRNIERTEFALQTQIAYASSDLGVEEHLRVDKKKVRQGEVPIIVLPQPNATVQPQVVSVAVPTPVERWQVWWLLFFGE